VHRAVLEHCMHASSTSSQTRRAHSARNKKSVTTIHYHRATDMWAMLWNCTCVITPLTIVDAC
jgi:hypothetical protein